MDGPHSPRSMLTSFWGLSKLDNLLRAIWKSEARKSTPEVEGIDRDQTYGNADE